MTAVNLKKLIAMTGAEEIDGPSAEERREIIKAKLKDSVTVAAVVGNYEDEFVQLIDKAVTQSMETFASIYIEGLEGLDDHQKQFAASLGLLHFAKFVRPIVDIAGEISTAQLAALCAKEKDSGSELGNRLLVAMEKASERISIDDIIDRVMNGNPGSFEGLLESLGIQEIEIPRDSQQERYMPRAYDPAREASTPEEAEIGKMYERGELSPMLHGQEALDVVRDCSCEACSQIRNLIRAGGEIHTFPDDSKFSGMMFIGELKHAPMAATQ